MPGTSCSRDQDRGTTTSASPGYASERRATPTIRWGLPPKTIDSPSTTVGSPPNARLQNASSRTTSSASGSTVRRRPATGAVPRTWKISGETASAETRRGASPSVQSRTFWPTPATASRVTQSWSRIRSRRGGESRHRTAPSVPSDPAPPLSPPPSSVSAGSSSKRRTTRSGSGKGMGASQTSHARVPTTMAEVSPMARVPATPALYAGRRVRMRACWRTSPQTPDQDRRWRSWRSGRSRCARPRIACHQYQRRAARTPSVPAMRWNRSRRSAWTGRRSRPWTPKETRRRASLGGSGRVAGSGVGDGPLTSPSPRREEPPLHPTAARRGVETAPRPRPPPR